MRFDIAVVHLRARAQNGSTRKRRDREERVSARGCNTWPTVGHVFSLPTAVEHGQRSDARARELRRDRCRMAFAGNNESIATAGRARCVGSAQRRSARDIYVLIIYTACGLVRPLAPARSACLPFLGFAMASRLSARARTCTQTHTLACACAANCMPTAY